MIRAIFAEVHVQSLVQADRYNVFNLFGNLLKLKLNILKQMSSDFVFGFIQAIDGERDPRNLILCFQNSCIVLKELDFSLFVEDFFEVLSCYFPVEFNPPKENDYGVTREQLVENLHNCLCCAPAFAPYSIPLFIEKLSSDMTESKRDSLAIMTDSLPDAGSHLQLFVKDVWMCIRKDFLFSEDEDLKRDYEKFIRKFVASLSGLEDKTELNHLMENFMKDCCQSLKDPDMSIAETSLPHCSAIVKV